jgi:ubiquinone/menaquinone biosynthesis C-methylase UbiE
MPPPSREPVRVRFLRFAFHHFYNRFAWTYDVVSATISLGHWREWTNAAIPHLRGKRILEIAFGTGNMQLDLRAAGLLPFGVDLSPNMVRLTARKLIRAGYRPRLTRASVLATPFANESFDTLLLTFPPNFLGLPQAVSEMRRILAVGGRVVIVNNGQLLKPALLSDFVNLAFRFTGNTDARTDPAEPLRAAGFVAQNLWAGDARSGVHVLIADKVVRDEQPKTGLRQGAHDAN